MGAKGAQSLRDGAGSRQLPLRSHRASEGRQEKKGKLEAHKEGSKGHFRAQASRGEQGPGLTGSRRWVEMPGSV